MSTGPITTGSLAIMALPLSHLLRGSQAIESHSIVTSEDFVPTFNGYELIDINNYGCWCRFGAGVARHGTPQDHLDVLCQHYFKNVQCLLADGVVENEAAIYDVTYNIVNTFAVAGTADIMQHCEQENGVGSDDKRAIVCSLHTIFTYEMFMHFFQGQAINLTLKADAGFSFEENCIAPATQILTTPAPVFNSTGNGGAGGNVPRDNSSTNNDSAAILPATATALTCCGNYPNRFPYNAANNRGCCQQKTYNTELYSCCSDGTLKTDALACA